MTQEEYDIIYRNKNGDKRNEVVTEVLKRNGLPTEIVMPYNSVEIKKAPKIKNYTKERVI